MIEVIENYKITFKEFQMKSSTKKYTKNEIFDFILKNNFDQKILSLKLLDQLKKDSFELFEFKKFYEDFEKNIIYQSQQIINDSMTPSQIFEQDSLSESSREINLND